jgi:hypothetical protein
VVQKNKQKWPRVLATVSVGHARAMETANAGSCSAASRSQLEFDGDEFHFRLTTATRSRSAKMSGGTMMPTNETIDGMTVETDVTASNMDAKNRMSGQMGW